MELFNSILTWIMKKRISQIELFMMYPHDTQQEQFVNLINQARDTEWGQKYDYDSIHSIEDFQQRVPVSSYEDLYPYIERLMRGEQNLLWPSEITWFAKSSGTTNARSKFIPVSQEALEACHFKGGKDMMTIFVNNKPDTKVFMGKGLSIGGSYQTNERNPESFYGDVSAVIMKNLPIWAQFIRTPGLDIALMNEWEEKIERMAQVTMDENVTSILGVPTWTIVLIRRILELKGKKNILEVWPNLELFAHGAVAFDPYRDLFNKELVPSPSMSYLELYNASEGFFGIQDRLGTNDMLLMLDYGVFYEFIPLEEIENPYPKALTLSQVELNKNYAMVISTNAGLWRYLIGDTVKFTTVNPYRIRITGRVKHFINAFGEEVIIENAEAAITKASEATDALIRNFTAAPVYMTETGKGGHEWAIEFEKEPEDLEKFTKILDDTLRSINSDYDAKRYQDMALQMPIVHSLPSGTFYNWMKKRGKLGGQHKVPRLSNNREHIEEVLEMVNEIA
ncbi:GH3 auxin-responsive promoter family protein [Cytophagaceae bacterium DM2B3-1]|uniref:GH3 auxin-responsive promoter family protein n=1 Tax=Xanthocytophaga flava TaxID=3048013 RepID=A0ABT7CXM4_9BACT|nr:GH3 auxin-responsive promoter family protein [Xanthocytophaga flavus]MDJ1467472.1 GH3 auxin-responsive promoter family protein [Xanthocytophaga flavus]MDJ1498497.1 GH3 auxin-responsive promoter family protein [Xanthocytophaga flavus]